MKKIDISKIDLNLLVVLDILVNERNVSRTATRLRRTQSTISHALARLREQLDDPIMVRVSGEMRPSPYVQMLAPQIHHHLQAIAHSLSNNDGAFNPATSTRTFILVIPDFAYSLLPLLYACIQQEAPLCTIEWQLPKRDSFFDLQSERCDLIVSPRRSDIPEGIIGDNLADLSWAVFMRKKHPALEKSWSKKTWASWPHLLIRVGDQHASPVTKATKNPETRRIAFYAPTFSSVPPLLAGSDLLATLPAIVLSEWLDVFGLSARLPPFDIPPLPQMLYYNARLKNDSANRWLRSLIQQTLDGIVHKTEEKFLNI